MSVESNSNPLGFKLRRSRAHPEARVSYVAPHQILRRILNFTGHSIDDVINNPIARRKVLHYYRMHKLIERRMEIAELEKQWNPIS